jgi:tetratricopeptide (TPR) repeat protein
VICRISALLAVLFIGSAAFAASTDSAVTNPVVSATATVETNDLVEAEYEKLLELDEAAGQEIDNWILENQKFAEQGAGVPKAELIRRIDKRRESVRAAYEDFIKRHPRHGPIRLAYASFLEDGRDLDGALEQMLKAKEIDPTNPAVWNNLANYYGHYGGVTNSFTHYEKAIELDPKESIYYQNFGTTVYLFRPDAMRHYGITEQQVFDKALVLYSNAMTLDPTNFLLATDVAMTYYGIKPPRWDDARAAWNKALTLADGSLQREGVLVHLGRIEINAGRFGQARVYLNSITNAELQELKVRVLRNLEAKADPDAEKESSSPPATAVSTNVPSGSAASGPRAAENVDP